MIVPLAVQLRYTHERPYLETLRALVADVLEPWAERMEFSVVTRIKELDSLAEKIETGEYSNWSELDDLLACAVVIPTHSREQAVLDFLDARFLTVGVKRRGQIAKPPDAFRFDSTRWRGRLRPHPEALRPEVDSLLFEVQVRSAFEHAWNITTHDVVYKAQSVEWRRTRLVAQMKAAVEQIDMLIDGFEVSADLLTDFPWRDFEQQAALGACFSTKLAAGLIDPSLAPKDWTRFCKNLLALIFASAPSRRRRNEHFDGCLAALDSHSGELPLSCSLLQSAFGILTHAGLVKRFETSYAPLITSELEQFFPSVKSFSGRFDLSV